jgi:5-methyltetrahydrofolate--homocysteine methyltransferase
MSRFKALLDKGIVFLDGATGTELSKRGMPTGVSPELWVRDNPESIQSVQRDYYSAGSDIVYSCTFGGNRIKLSQYTQETDDTPQINSDLAQISKSISDEKLVFGDMAPTGKFIEPFGSLTFDEAVEVYREQAQGLRDGGVDGLVIETMMDIQEVRAALLGARLAAGELPVVVTMTFDSDGYTLNGTHIRSALSIVQSMGAAAFGCNCSTGPAEMLELIRLISNDARIPLMAKPNAGLPKLVNGETTFTMEPDEFASFGKDFIEAGVHIIGGCCGTTPVHIQRLKEELTAVAPVKRPRPQSLILGTAKEGVSTSPKEPMLVVDSSDTGRFVQCTPEELIKSMKAYVIHDSKIPLISYESSLYKVTERALRLYPGRGVILTSEKDYSEIRDIAIRYGSVVLFKAAVSHPLSSEHDTVVITDSKIDSGNANEEGHTLFSAYSLERSSSSDMEDSELLYSIASFYQKPAPIIVGTPNKKTLSFIAAYNALTGRDHKLSLLMKTLHEDNRIGQSGAESKSESNNPVYDAVLHGNDTGIEAAIRSALDIGLDPKQIVDDQLIPAINQVGELYEKKEYFLPQLIMSADAMRKGFTVLEPLLAAKSGVQKKDGIIVIATVKGDIHDIGKNIVTLMLRNYNFEVIDLGKDVDDETIINKALEVNADIIALSALMTTTMTGMKQVVESAKARNCKAKIIIGGAVVDQNYSDEIGADGYSPDAMAAVKLAKRLVANEK